MRKLVLQIYKDEVPLTQEAAARIIKAIKDEHLREIANSTFNTDDLPKRCDNKSHTLYRKCVGGGICLARKYKRLFSNPDQICSSCQSQGIVDTINYMFAVFYEEQYRAEWRQPRRTKRSKPVRPEVKEKSGKTVKETQIETLNQLEDKTVKNKKTVPDLKQKQPEKAAPKQHRVKKIVQGGNRRRHAEAV